MTRTEVLADFEKSLEQMLYAANVMGLGGDIRKIIKKKLSGEHRTIQQSFVRDMLVPMIETMSEQGTDLRNQDGVELCKKMRQIAEETALPFI